MNEKFKIIITILISLLVCIELIIILNTKNLQKNNPIEISKSKEYPEYKVSSFITDEIINNSERIQMLGLYTQNISPENTKKDAEFIAIVQIISCDYSSTEYDSVAGQTFGKMLINNVIKGNLKPGEILDYAAIGGYLTIEEWESKQPEEANQKREYLRKQNGITIDKSKTYMHIQFDKCIDAEEGITYLAYFNYNKEMGKYEFIGFHNGLMKLDLTKKKSVSVINNLDMNDVKVLNNNTRQYENLNDYIEKNINE